jgi:hypothetical protein
LADSGPAGFDVARGRIIADTRPLILPTDTQRITIIGKTGSGKTQGAVWLLAKRSYTTKPWIIFDYKYEQLLNDIPGTREIDVSDKPPKKPGLYIVHPTPADTDAVEALMWQIWQREHIGIFVDEGYMISPRSPAFQAILTQGRSKVIPVIMLTQRPAWVTRFAFSEADYIQLFQLTDTRDAKIVKQFMPLPIETALPAPYYSWWWDNARNYKAVLQPVPDATTILDVFHRRLIQPRRVI